MKIKKYLSYGMTKCGFTKQFVSMAREKGIESRSIKTSSGGILGSRNYLEMIYSQFTQAGKWGHLFK